MERFIYLAFKEAEKALTENEIPVGAVLVKDNKIIAQDHNRTRQLNDPLAHAEKLVIDEAIRNHDKYLYDYTLYVTLEPCTMCAGAIVWSRVGRVVFCAYDEKGGAAGSVYNILQDKNLNHNPELIAGVQAERSSALLKRFFHAKRAKHTYF